MYHEKHLSWTHTTASPVTGLWFGRYGREDNTLIIVCRNGALEIKVWNTGVEGGCGWNTLLSSRAAAAAALSMQARGVEESLDPRCVVIRHR